MGNTLDNILLRLCLQRETIGDNLILREILGGDDLKGIAVRTFFSSFKGSSSQRHHFLKLISRVDDVARWKDFLIHENKKAKSPWKCPHSPNGDLIVEFANKLPDWMGKTYTPTAQIDQMFDTVCGSLVEGVTGIDFSPILSDETYRVWRREVLRRVLRNTLRGGQS